MSELHIAGGVYHEHVAVPAWQQIYGSGGRAAAAAVTHVKSVHLKTYCDNDTANAFTTYSQVYGFDFLFTEIPKSLSFHYLHCLSKPTLQPLLKQSDRTAPSLRIAACSVLRFGMLEGTAVVNATRCVYDPQNPINPESFHENGSQSTELAIVGNAQEVCLLGRSSNIEQAAKYLIRNEATLVVVKDGIFGAKVFEGNTITRIPAYKTDFYFTVGSGDVFSAIFAARWCVHGDNPIKAARLASLAVAGYVSSRALPVPVAADLKISKLEAAEPKFNKIYLAGPFFTIAQRWLIEETREHLSRFGLEVFSPLHDVGFGESHHVAPSDLAGIDRADVVFAILDGSDTGTIFEVGYAVKAKKRVICLVEALPPQHLTMIEGSNCELFSDLVTAIHATIWG